MYAVSVDRTRDLQIFSLTLSQLSYPRKVGACAQSEAYVFSPGFEPETFSVLD
jgi:hypothetical protein